jgi:antirestriction protein
MAPQTTGEKAMATANKTEMTKVIEIAAKYFNLSIDADSVETIEEMFQGEYTNRAEWAAEYLDNCDFFSGVEKRSREVVKMYFDFDSYARDCELNGDVVFVSNPHADSILVFDNN